MNSKPIRYHGKTLSYNGKSIVKYTREPKYYFKNASDRTITDKSIDERNQADKKALSRKGSRFFQTADKIALTQGKELLNQDFYTIFLDGNSTLETYSNLLKSVVSYSKTHDFKTVASIGYTSDIEINRLHLHVFTNISRSDFLNFLTSSDFNVDFDSLWSDTVESEGVIHYIAKNGKDTIEALKLEYIKHDLTYTDLKNDVEHIKFFDHSRNFNFADIKEDIVYSTKQANEIIINSKIKHLTTYQTYVGDLYTSFVAVSKTINITFSTSTVLTVELPHTLIFELVKAQELSVKVRMNPKVSFNNLAPPYNLLSG